MQKIECKRPPNDSMNHSSPFKVSVAANMFWIYMAFEAAPQTTLSNTLSARPSIVFFFFWKKVENNEP